MYAPHPQTTASSSSSSTSSTSATQTTNTTLALLDVIYAKNLIIAQLKKIISKHKHSEDESLRVELRRLIKYVEDSPSQTPLEDFATFMRSGHHQISENIKKSILGFIKMEIDSLRMEAIRSNRLDSNSILEYIREGKKHAEKAKNLDIVIFVGNTGAGKSTMINALDGCKLAWGKYFPGVAQNDEGTTEYEEETLFDLPEIKRLDNNKLFILKSQISGWAEGFSSIQNFISLITSWNVNVTSEVTSLLQKAIDQRNSQNNQNNYRRVIRVDERNNNKKAVTPIGHSLKSCTFYPVVTEGSEMHYTDCPGFIEIGTKDPKEREISNSVNTMQTLSQARSVKVVIMINYYSLLSDKGRGLSELWSIIQHLFGNKDNVLKYRDTILINISQVPEVPTGNLPNSLEGIRKFIGEKNELIPFLEQVFICDPMDRTYSQGSIKQGEFSHKIKSLQPVRNPAKVFRTAISEGTASALLLFANDARKDILEEMDVYNFNGAYNKLNYLLQLCALKDEKLDEEIVEIKKEINKRLQFFSETVHQDKGIAELEKLSEQLYEGILLDKLVGGNTVKNAYFNAKLLILKLLLKQPVFQKEVIEKHVQDMYCLMNHFDVEVWQPKIMAFIEDVFYKGNQIAITPNLDKKAEKLFGLVNSYLATHQGTRYGVMTPQDFTDISQKAQKPVDEIFNLLKTAGWLKAIPGQPEALIDISEEKLLSPDAKLPPELSAPAVREAVIKLFEERLMIDAFFVKKFMKFKENQGKAKDEIVKQIFDKIQSRVESDAHKLHQIKELIRQYFSYEKADRYLKFLKYLEPLDKELVEKRYKLLDKIKTNFKTLDNSLSKVSSHVPVGSIHAIPSSHIPEGFKECNGEWLPVNIYTALYHVVRDTFGERQITTTGDKEFQLPNYRGYFLRGMSNNRFFKEPQNDTTRLPRNLQFTTSNNGSHIHSGSTSGDGSHTHSHVDYQLEYGGKMTIAGGKECGGTYVNSTTGNDGYHSHNLNVNLNGDHTHTITGGGDSETRPQNYPVTYMIKF